MFPSKKETKKSKTKKSKPKKPKVEKSQEWTEKYNCVVIHCKSLIKLYGKAPKVNEKMSLEKLQKIYDEIHAGKYGKL